MRPRARSNRPSLDESMITGVDANFGFFLISACSPETPKKEMPAVNDENCKPDRIAQVEDKGTREQFASACLRRGPTFQPSPKKEW